MGVRVVFLDQRVAAAQRKGEGDQSEIVAVPAGTMTMRRAVLGYLVAAVAIVVAGPFLATSASQIAAVSGMGESFVGTLFVAISTSLPEMVASLAALRLRAAPSGDGEYLWQ